MATRPDLGRDESYNRIRVSTNLKNEIYSQIADSSESLPLPSVTEDPESIPADPTDFPKQEIRSPPTTGATSNLAHSTLSSDIPTPTPEKPNPLEQVPTIRKDGEEMADLKTPSPVRSHEVTPTHSNPIAPRIIGMITEDDSTLSLPTEEGVPASKQRSSDTVDSDGSGKRPKMQGRQSTMRRIGSAIKKTISNKHE